jgi:tRNA uridine 5-carboxymethylaminomethyl modification enzyme
VVITTGTFLRGLMHCGEQQARGGRIGEPAAMGLSATLAALGFTLGRLKTGTPPRIHRDSIQYDRCEAQPGDDVPTPFSFLTDAITQPQINCWVTWTNARVHRHITANLHRAPMYSGQIQSRGPRYCPSIEDKVVRFADKDKHQIFLEPEGYDHERVYCNGISTSLPKDVQEAFVHEVPGLEDARILQHGYAVEYDFVPTHQTRISLETKWVDGLFLAGQINGTSGYEEAAGQGLVAGINAVRFLRNQEPLVLRRDEAYIGVMIDDLITRPPTEPYRMFTSRAEYRLRLRADNADQRLTPLGRKIGTIDDARWERFRRKRDAMETIASLCGQGRVNGSSLATWIRRPDADLDAFATALANATDRTFDAEDLWQILTDARYTGYVDRQERQIDRFRRLESMRIPECLDYGRIPDLRAEARERLALVAPRTLGQAGRISGVNPADITILWVYLRRQRGCRKPA